jgi:hypothetical protein
VVPCVAAGLGDMRTLHPLQALGLSATAEAACLALVEWGPQTLTELTDRPGLVGSPSAGLEDAVAELGAIGLMSRTGRPVCKANYPFKNCRSLSETGMSGT